MTAERKTYHEAVREFKKELLRRTLDQHKGNKTHAARALGLQRTYLVRLLRDLGLVQRDEESDPPAKAAASSNGTRCYEVVLPTNGPRPIWPLPPKFIWTPARVSFTKPRAV